MLELSLFHHQAVRDLAWAIFGPNLIDDYRFHSEGAGINSCQIPLTDQRRAWLAALDQDTTPLMTALATRKSTRLGIYFEYLWQFFIQSDPELTLLANNLPVFHGKKTLGEFDILYRNEVTGEIFHLELATKYFLSTIPNPADLALSQPCLSNWLGPNTKDRLDKKLHRLLSHQTRLSELPEGKQLLQQKGWETVQPSIALKGFLFSHPDSAPHNTAKNQSPLTAHHNQGTWYPIDRSRELYSRSPYWLILQRPQWISPAQVSGNQNLAAIYSQEEIRDITHSHFQSPEARPLMICAMQQKDDDYIELSRYILTHATWPAPNTPEREFDKN